MASLDMDGPYALTEQEIRRVVSEPLPGSFAIGRMTNDKRFLVRYVGRDDKDLRQALLKWVPAAKGSSGLLGRLKGGEPPNDCFKFSYAMDATAAFEKQCRAYHAFNQQGRLKNGGHPKPPGRGRMDCPICGAR